MILSLCLLGAAWLSLKLFILTGPSSQKGTSS